MNQQELFEETYFVLTECKKNKTRSLIFDLYQEIMDNGLESEFNRYIEERKNDGNIQN